MTVTGISLYHWGDMKRTIIAVLLTLLVLSVFVACDDGKTPDTYCTIAFDANGGSGSMTPQTVKKGVPATLSTNGFSKKSAVFLCWNTKPDGTGESYADRSVITVSGYTKLYAQWLAEVTVTFDGNGSTGGSMPVQTMYDGVASVLTYNGFSRTGYGFKGWNTRADGKGTYYSDEESIVLHSDTVLYAQWSNKTASVTFDASGGSGAMDARTVASGIPSLLPFNGYTKTGCLFNGWNTAPDGTGTAYADHGSITITEDTVLYAQWRQELTVTFDGNGASSGAMPVQVVYKGEDSKLATNAFRRDVHGFNGWNTAANGTGTPYADEAEFKPTENLKLYAQWTEETAVITFDANGGSGTMNRQTIARNTPSLLSYRTFYRSGYVFRGWNTKDDGSGTAYADHATIDLNADITLYAQWIKELTVTFDGNGSTEGTMPLQTVYEGNSVVLNSNTFRRDGYGFDCWNTKADGTGTSYADGAYVTPSEDMTLYARWSSETVTVTFDSNGADGGYTDPQTVGINTATVLSGNGFRKYDSVFRGWNTRADGTGTGYGDRDIIIADCDITLYAQWARRLAITFDGNGATGGGMPLPQVICEGDSAKLMQNEYEKTGYAFNGWNTEADGTGTPYAEEEVISPISDMTLYAQWTDDAVTVTFDGRSAEGTMSPQKIARNVPSLLSYRDYFKPGYRFRNWNTKSDGSGTAYADRAYITLDEDITLYAQWREEFEICFQGNGSTSGSMKNQYLYEDDSVVLSSNAFRKTGYEFIGWNTKADGTGTAYVDGALVTPTEDMILYAQWIGASVR